MNYFIEKYKGLFKRNDVCMCECHKNKNVMHFMPCCQLVYQHYIEDDNSINTHELDKLMNNYIYEQSKKEK